MAGNTWHEVLVLKQHTMTLVAENLSCERNGRLVFSNLSFTIGSGQCAELRGSNGSGKSSLLRVVAGLVPALHGQVLFNAEAELRTALHFIAHQNAIKSALTVSENMQFWCKALGGTSIAAALDAFGLRDLKHQPALLLSAGQQRRLTLSRLFLQQRPIWLLDEPMTALDHPTQALLREHISTHLKTNGIVLAATHGDLGFTPDQVIKLGET
jgi:heme exporter protein A